MSKNNMRVFAYLICIWIMLNGPCVHGLAELTRVMEISYNNGIEACVIGKTEVPIRFNDMVRKWKNVKHLSTLRVCEWKTVRGRSEVTEVGVTAGNEDVILYHIPDGCFSQCIALTDIELPGSVTTIPDTCFCDCVSLRMVVLNQGLKCIGDCCFAQCFSLKWIVLPDSVESIGELCFSQCGSLNDVVLPANLKSIGEMCFAFCNGLHKMTIPEGVVSIGDGCFRCCESLIETNLPGSLKAFGHVYFDGCLSLQNISVTYQGKLKKVVF